MQVKNYTHDSFCTLCDKKTPHRFAFVPVGVALQALRFGEIPEADHWVRVHVYYTKICKVCWQKYGQGVPCITGFMTTKQADAIMKSD